MFKGLKSQPLAVITTLMLGLCIWSGYSVADEHNSQANQLHKLVDEIWAYELEVNPLMASSEGVSTYDHKLADISPTGLKLRNQRFSGYLVRLAAIDQSKLERDDLITLLMQKYRIQNYVDLYQLNDHFVPITSEYGFHSALAQLPNRVKIQTAQDSENYLQRLSLVSGQIKQHIAWMREGMKVRDCGVSSSPSTITGSPSGHSISLPASIRK